MSDFVFPKIIWRYWHQGWDNAPFPLKYCTESVQHYAPDWKIVDLDCKSVKDYIDIPKELERADFPLATLSDLIRIKLLDQYGGVWIDSTVFLNRNLTEFLQPLQGDFFCFWRWKEKRTMSSWFLAAKKGSYIARKTADRFAQTITSAEFLEQNCIYFNKWRGSPNYFIFHRIFNSLSETDNSFGEIVKAMPFEYSKIVMHCFHHGWNKPIPHEYETLIRSDAAPMIKLSYSVKEKDFNPESTLALLLKKMRGEEMKDHGHLHVSSGLRTTFMFNSFINRPDKIGEYAGQFESDSDLKLCSEAYPKYHVYNFSSLDNKHGAQLLIPHDTARMFLRFQQGSNYSQAREFAFIDSDVENKYPDPDMRTMLSLALNLRRLRRQYFFYRLSSHFTFGKLRQRCTQEKRRLRTILKKAETFAAESLADLLEWGGY